MMTSKHPKPDEHAVDLRDDEDRQPGIGQSKGLFARAGGEDQSQIEGENTVEGDIANDSAPAGGVGKKLGRTNG